MARRRVPPEEVDATIAARRELGAELEPELIEGFLERIEERLDERGRQPARRKPSDERDKELALAIVSILAGIPVSAITLSVGGIVPFVIAWAAIVLVNLAYNR